MHSGPFRTLSAGDVLGITREINHEGQCSLETNLFLTKVSHFNSQALLIPQLILEFPSQEGLTSSFKQSLCINPNTSAPPSSTHPAQNFHEPLVLHAPIAAIAAQVQHHLVIMQFKMHNNYQKLISITYEIMTIKQMIFKLYMVQMIYIKMFKICIKRNFYKHN